MTTSAEMATPKENPLILYYGNSGLGKTVAALYAFPHAEYIAAPGSLIPSETVCGFTLRPEQVHSDVRTLDDAIKLIKKSPSKQIIIDDMTILADQTAVQAKSDFGGDKFGAWDLVYAKFMELRQEARYKGALIVANAHLKDPGKDADGRRVLGTVDFPGSGRKKFPAAFEMVLHCENRKRLYGWGAVVRAKPSDPEFTATKDRLNVSFDGAPLNFAELLRCYGIECSRIEGLSIPEIESLIEAVSGEIYTSLLAKQLDDVDTLLSDTRAMLVELGVTNHKHQDWILRDTFDRADIRVLQEVNRGSIFQRKKKP
jgi:hypothetical protein